MDTELNDTDGQQQQQLQQMDTAAYQQQQQQPQALNSWEDNLLDEYEQEIDKNLNDQLHNEKDQLNQKLFQSFQNSACAVAQMFKDKQQQQQQQNLNQWQSFQNAAGSITYLYKDSLDACKCNYDLGIQIGQQRKLKELINWLRNNKKNNPNKRRNYIRKDELLSFLIGKQLSTSSSAANILNNRLRQQQQQQQQLNNRQTLNNLTSTHSDLATFREALIMHNRTSNHTHSHQHHNNHHHHHQQSLLLNTSHQQQQQHTNCDDLDCFFCEQIATHIEHKRSSSNLDMDSPTRKRSRFY